jgi:murein tripeptide amidase MpaA
MRTPPSELLQQKHPIEFAKGSVMSQSNSSPSLAQLLKAHQKKQTDIKRQNGMCSMTILHWNAVWHDISTHPFWIIGQLCKEATTAAAELNDTLTTTINDR